LARWNFQAPALCAFHVEEPKAVGGAIPASVEKHVRENFFAPEDFDQFIVACARQNETMKRVLVLLREPPARSDQDVIPFLGDNAGYEHVLRVAARGKIALNVKGTWRRREPGQTEEEALQLLKQRAYCSGKEMYDVQLGDPGQVGGTGVAVALTTGSTAGA